MIKLIKETKMKRTELKKLIKETLNENLSTANIGRMDGLVKTKSYYDFERSALDMLEDLTEDGYEADEACDYLIHIIKKVCNL